MMVSSNAFFSYSTKISQIRQKNLNRSKNQWDGCVFLAVLFTHCCKLSMFSRHAKSSLVRVIVSSLPKSTTWLLE